MGVLGEMFPGKKLADTGGEDSDGKLRRPRFDIDLDSGVVRMPNLAAAPAGRHRDESDGPDEPGAEADATG